MTQRTEGTIVSAPIAPGRDTNDDIAAAVGSEIQGNFQYFATIDKRDEWSGKYKSRLFRTIALVLSSNDDGEPGWYRWDGTRADGSDGGWKAVSVAVVSNSTGDAKGIVIDDGQQNVAGVTTLNFASMIMQPDPDDPKAVRLAPFIQLSTLDNSGSPTQFNAAASSVKLMPPLQTFEDPNEANTAILEIKHGIYEQAKPPGYLAYLSDNVEIIGKVGTANQHHDGAVWFDDIVVPSGPFISLDKPNKTIGIQEADELDPNVSGGTDYLICYRVAMKGVAPNDGMVRIYLLEKQEFGQPAQLIHDVNDNPLTVERHYKVGEKLDYLDLSAVVNAKGLVDFSCHIVDNFNDDTLVIEDRTEGASGIMIQALTSTGKTGDALQQYEIDTAQNIEFSSHYLGSDRASINWLLRQNMPVAEGAPGKGQTMNDGFHFYNLTALKMGVDSGHFVVQDNGSDIADFSFGKIFSAEETQMLRGHTVKVTVSLTDKDDAFNVSLVKWTGKPGEYTPAIYTSRDGAGMPVFESGWFEVDKLFISEDTVSGDHQAEKTFQVPADANNYAVIIYPVTAQQPLTLKLSQFNVDVTTPFIGYALHAPENVKEFHLIDSDRHKRLLQDNQGNVSLRYTLNDVPGDGLPMPVGKLGEGAADISLDTSVGAVPGSDANGGEGAIKFNTDGDAIIKTAVRLWSEQSPETISTVRFWYSRVGPGDQLTKIPDSELTVSVKGGTSNALYSMPQFTESVIAGDRIVLRATTNRSDGAFIQSTSSDKPMIDTTIDFNELVAVGEYDDPFGQLDVSQFDQVYDHGLTVVKHVVGESSATIPIALPVDADLMLLDAVKKVNGVVRPVKNLDYSYSNGVLSVSFGEVADVKLTLGIYL